jgi:Domain of unknown function (DUF4410)
MRPFANVRFTPRFVVWTLSLALTTTGVPFFFGAQGPLAADVEVTSLKTYDGEKTLSKPDKIVVYDFAFDPADVQVDTSQEIRPRHLIKGDENPQHIGNEAAKKMSDELIKQLAKTGFPVEHAKPGDTAPDNALVVTGSFLLLKQGVKTERVVVGMGAGSAAVNARVNVHVRTPQEQIVVSEFETRTTEAKNVGAGVTAAAGVDPAAAAARSTVGDRKKTVDAYASKTADATASQITAAMAKLGWVKLDNKGKVVK